MCDTPELINAIVLLTAGTPMVELISMFESLGFEISTLTGTNGFLIMGEPTLFDNTFAVEIMQKENGATFLLDAEEAEIILLPLESLDTEIRDNIQLIELQQPIEFGPVDY